MRCENIGWVGLNKNVEQQCNTNIFQNTRNCVQCWRKRTRIRRIVARPRYRGGRQNPHADGPSGRAMATSAAAALVTHAIIVQPARRSNTFYQLLLYRYDDSQSTRSCLRRVLTPAIFTEFPTTYVCVCVCVCMRVGAFISDSCLRTPRARGQFTTYIRCIIVTET